MSTLYKPAPPHNHLLAPGTCLCVGCCRIVATLRCAARDADGFQCGDYKWHRGVHTQMVATTFDIVDERLRVADGSV